MQYIYNIPLICIGNRLIIILPFDMLTYFALMEREAGGGKETSGGENRLSSSSVPMFIWMFLMFGIL